MKKIQTKWFYVCVIALTCLGLQFGSKLATKTVSAAKNSLVEPHASAAVNEGCSANITNIKIQRASGGNNFTVSWEAPSPCLGSFDVTLTVTKLSGAERTDKKTIKGRSLVASFSFIGDGDLNPIKKARATVTGTGILAAKAELTKSLGLSSGTGSNAPVAPTPVPTFFVRGQILNSQTGAPLAGVKLEFDVIGSPFGKSSVETNSQGRWVQEGFQVGKPVRITVSKRFFVFEPPTRVVSEGGVVEFKARPNDVGASPASFSASGRAVVDNLAQGTQSPLAGATISFSVQNASGQTPTIPGSVTTQAKGNWAQSGFTVGVTYKATIAKAGVTFSNPSSFFSGSSADQVVSDVGFIGSIPGTPPPPGPPFAASGQANVISASQGTTSPLAGATITFKFQNPATAGSANVPASVVTQSDGKWSQSGFTGGVKYFATITKAGVSFSNATREINGPSQVVNFTGKVK